MYRRMSFLFYSAARVFFSHTSIAGWFRFVFFLYYIYSLVIDDALFFANSLMRESIENQNIIITMECLLFTVIVVVAGLYLFIFLFFICATMYMVDEC